MNQNQIFDVDNFYFKVIEDITKNIDNKQEKFRIVYKALNTFVRKAPELDDTQTLANGLRYLLGLFNNKPIDGFTEKKPKVGKNERSILKQEFGVN